MATIITRTFPIDPAALLPQITPDSEPFWSGLAEGQLKLQVCKGCSKARHPISPACPYCGSNQWEWREMSGEGSVFSYARFHRSYLPEFEDLMPYVVLSVQLAEGPRMFGRLVDRNVTPRIGDAVCLAIERWPDGRCVAAFELKTKPKEEAAK